ncbi:Uncharacterized protein HZ326_20052, partial [Fusarium oxysporum f. sp. albedinis]
MESLMTVRVSPCPFGQNRPPGVINCIVLYCTKRNDIVLIAICLKVGRVVAFVPIEDQKPIATFRSDLCVLIEVLDPLEGGLVIGPAILGRCNSPITREVAFLAHHKAGLIKVPDVSELDTVFRDCVLYEREPLPNSIGILAFGSLIAVFTMKTRSSGYPRTAGSSICSGSTEGAASYGFAIHQKDLSICDGSGRLGPAEVFDAEATGALEGLKAALNLPGSAARDIVVC